MSRMTKLFLGLAVGGLGSGLLFVSGLIDVQLSPLYVTLPAGAIFLGLFLISFMLEKEVSAFDKEQALNAVPPPARASIGENQPGAVPAHSKFAPSKV